MQTSCGYGVPRLSSVAPKDPEKAPEAAFEDRETMGHWASNKIDKNELHTYQMEWNAKSLDGLSGLRAARRDLGERLWLADRKAAVMQVMAQREALIAGILIGIILAFVARLGESFLLRS